MKYQTITIHFKSGEELTLHKDLSDGDYVDEVFVDDPQDIESEIIFEPEDGNLH